MKTYCTAFLVGAALLTGPKAAFAQIDNIHRFMETCPSSDPAVSQILRHFTIRSNGVVVTQFPCTEPISTMTVSNYTDPLIVLQGLRVMYYMDRGMSGHLPWTPGTLYDWMKSQIKGIDVRSNMGNSFCCETFPDGRYIAIKAQDDRNRDYDRRWPWISGNIGLYAHETRHAAGGYSHSSCCGITGGCDNAFDTNNLSAYAVQWWLEKAWLYGDINVGFSCADSTTVKTAADWHLSGCNSQFRNRFCTNLPPVLSMPNNPGGICSIFPQIASPATASGRVGELFSFQIQANNSATSFEATGLPAGLNVNRATGLISGTPAVAGIFTVSLSASNASGPGSSTNVTLMVQKATPVISWSNPAPINFGTALSARELNATANVSGTFTYSPTTGMVLPAGDRQNLSVTFSPSDTINYNTSTATVAIDVKTQPLSISAISDQIS